MDRHPRLRRALLWTVRYGIGCGLILAGIIALGIGGLNDTTLEGSAGLIGAGLAILLFNVLVRIGVQGDRDREREDAARSYFDRHGRWPDEAAPPRGPDRRPTAGPAGAAPRDGGPDRAGAQPYPHADPHAAPHRASEHRPAHRVSSRARPPASRRPRPRR